MSGAPGQSANGNAVGLPHLQPATVDPPAQTTTRNCLNPQRRDRNRETPCANQTTPPVSATHSPARAPFHGVIEDGFFTASNREGWGSLGRGGAKVGQPPVRITLFRSFSLSRIPPFAVFPLAPERPRQFLGG